MKQKLIQIYGFFLRRDISDYLKMIAVFSTMAILWVLFFPRNDMIPMIMLLVVGLIALIVIKATISILNQTRLFVTKFFRE